MTKDWAHGVVHSPVCQILLQIIVRAVITSSPPSRTSSAGMLSTPADFPFFNDCTAASTSLRRMGWSLCVCLGTVQYWWISIGIVVVQLRAVFCPSVQYLLLFCEAFSWTILDSSRFPLFHSGQVFHQLVCPLTVVLPQIFFNLTTLFSYEAFFSLFLSSLLLSHRSRISAVIQFFFLVFFLTMFAKDLTGCFSHCCVEGGDHWIHVCIFIVQDGKRCKLPADHSLEGFQHIGIFQLFEVKLESCVFARWFFSGEGGRSSSASHDHFQCLLLKNFVFWHCSLLIGSTSSLECNQSGCGVVHLGYARSIVWMLCYDQKCSPTQDR